MAEVTITVDVTAQQTYSQSSIIKNVYEQEIPRNIANAIRSQNVLFKGLPDTYIHSAGSDLAKYTANIELNGHKPEEVVDGIAANMDRLVSSLLYGYVVELKKQGEILVIHKNVKFIV